MSVYFVTCREANAVKIGKSVEPHARLGEIQLGCPLELKLEAILPGGHEEERGFHSRFKDDHIRGEWFRLTPLIEAIIANNPAPALPPDHDETARVQRERLKLNFRELEYAKTLATRRIQETAATRPPKPFDRRMLSASHRKRVESGDITFPFRAKEDA